MSQFEFALRVRVYKWSMNLVIDRRKSIRSKAIDHPYQRAVIESSDLRVDASNVQRDTHAQHGLPFTER